MRTNIVEDRERLINQVETLTQAIGALGFTDRRRLPTPTAPEITNILPALLAALVATDRPFNIRDQHEAQTIAVALTALHNDNDKTKAINVLLERAQLLLYARSYGWGYTAQLIRYREDINAGLDAVPPPLPPRGANTRGLPRRFRSGPRLQRGVGRGSRKQ